MQVIVQPADLRWPFVGPLATDGPPNFAISVRVFWVISSLCVLHVSFIISTVYKMKKSWAIYTYLYVKYAYGDIPQNFWPYFGDMNMIVFSYLPPPPLKWNQFFLPRFIYRALSFPREVDPEFQFSECRLQVCETTWVSPKFQQKMVECNPVVRHTKWTREATLREFAVRL